MAGSVRIAVQPRGGVVTAVSRPSPAVAPSAGRPSRRTRLHLTRAERKGLRTGLLFISPWLVGFVCFTLYPALASLYYSFTNFKILQTPRWVGLDNYANLLKDPLFWKSLTNTLFLTLIGVPLAIIVALGIGLLLNNKRVRGLGAFRTVFYLPVVSLRSRRRCCGSSCSTRRSGSSTRRSLSSASTVRAGSSTRPGPRTG